MTVTRPVRNERERVFNKRGLGLVCMFSLVGFAPTARRGRRDEKGRFVVRRVLLSKDRAVAGRGVASPLATVPSFDVLSRVSFRGEKGWMTNGRCSRAMSCAGAPV